MQNIDKFELHFYRLMTVDSTACITPMFNTVNDMLKLYISIHFYSKQKSKSKRKEMVGVPANIQFQCVFIYFFDSKSNNCGVWSLQVFITFSMVSDSCGRKEGDSTPKSKELLQASGRMGEFPFLKM